MKTNKEIANSLQEAWRQGVSIPPIADQMEYKTIENAYQIQYLWMNGRKNGDNPLIGRKIGLTNPKVQKQLGVDQPDFGVLLKDFFLPENELDLVELIQGKAEAEIAIVLKEDIDSPIRTLAKALDKIAYAMPCMEIVDSRIKDWKISIYDTIADNASAGFYVIGKEKVAPENVNWESAKMQMWSDGNLVSEGEASQCMGNPLKSFQWLANKMIELRTHLHKGEIILTGALGPMHDLKKNQYLKAEIESVGTVDLNII